jgi:cytochrome c oxidase cbb3-type subunit 3
MEKNEARVLVAALAIAVVGGVGGYWYSTRAPPVPVAPVVVTEASLLALSSDPVALAEGKQIFDTVCMACHGPQGQGLVGPNLTDSAWIHGPQPLQIHVAISKGFPEKGMAPMESVVGAAKVRSLTAYVLTLRGKNLPGKAPEGTVSP